MVRVVLLAFASLAQAIPQFGQGGSRSSLLRFGCETLVIDRIDPLVNPGQAPTPHVHQIIGGNAFNATIPSTDVSKLADCTTCSLTDDNSNYWTANVYFKARNGSFKRVPQAPNRCVSSIQSSPTSRDSHPGGSSSERTEASRHYMILAFRSCANKEQAALR
jgi:hypothetical protein